jgi:hypothetical protein
MFLKKRRRGLPNNKRLEGSMWSGYLMCSNLDGLLFGTLIEHGALRTCGR